jgi:hypothetical protein
MIRNTTGSSRRRLFTTDINGVGPPENGQWEDILLIQPPIKRLGVWRLNSWFGFLGYAQMVTCVPGVTFGAVYKAAREVVGKHNGLKTAAVYLRGDDLVEVDFVQRWVDALPKSSSIRSGFGLNYSGLRTDYWVPRIAQILIQPPLGGFPIMTLRVEEPDRKRVLRDISRYSCLMIQAGAREMQVDVVHVFLFRGQSMVVSQD